jgi:sigma-B regulation protein RsbU (phosphoserine phosphatase)
VSIEEELLWESPEELFEDAPCGYLATKLDGTILKVNRTFEAWTGFARKDLLADRRFQDLLTRGGRIYHETHFAPLLQMQGSVREVAFEIVRADGSRLPALVNSVVRGDARGRPGVIKTTVFDATDRRRYERELLRARREEQEIARQLQRSLLSGELPATPELAVEVAYDPGVSSLEIGGDWYDAFWLEPNDTAALVIGDVVGRGLQAAASMGQLRSAVRAFASTGLTPDGVLSAVDRFSARHSVGRMATLLYAQLNVSSGTLRFACAGHLPPLLVMPGEEPCYLWEGRSLPIDSRLALEVRRDSAEVQLTPGSALLLYTDGLVERRGSSLDEGMSRLLSEVSCHRLQLPGGSARATIHALRHTEDYSDDVCLLVARLGGDVPAAL